MSTTYDLICRECKVALWVGQSSGNSPPHVYGGDEYTKKIGDFLVQHTGHHLEFNSEHSFNNNLYGPYEYKVLD